MSFKNEAQVVGEAVKGLKARLPGAVIFKHSDLRTAGIPDLSISYSSKTMWVEVKHLRSGKLPDLKKAFSGVQLATMVILSRQLVMAYYLVAYGDAGCALFTPQAVKDFLKLPPIAARDFSMLLKSAIQDEDLPAVLNALADRLI